jgi:hypothetical protein
MFIHVFVYMKGETTYKGLSLEIYNDFLEDSYLITLIHIICMHVQAYRMFIMYIKKKVVCLIILFYLG